MTTLEIETRCAAIAARMNAEVVTADLREDGEHKDTVHLRVRRDGKEASAFFGRLSEVQRNNVAIRKVADDDVIASLEAKLA